LKHPKKQNNRQSVQITQTQASFYSGKLPPPEMMEQYNLIDSTFAERIISMSEKEQIHFHRIERTKLRIGIMMALLGMFCGVVALEVLYYSIERDNTAVAVGITAIIASVVAIFVLQKRLNKKENI